MALRLLAVSAIMASAVSAVTVSFGNSDCPDNWSVNTIKDKSWCCFGSGNIVNNDGYCCVSNFQGTGKIDPDDEINSDCFPFCDRKRQNTDLCAEKIPFSASDYSERVSAASKSVMSKATATDSPASTTADATNSADESATTTGDSDQASETGNSDSADETETNSDNAVGPLPTGNAMAKLGGAVAAAAIFAL